MTRVLVFGTFDELHSGHLFFLRTARALGDTLVVAVARDAYVREQKHREPTLSEGERLEAVRALSYVDQALLCDNEPGSFAILDDVKPDLIVLGHDQDALANALAGKGIALRRLEEFPVEGCANCTCGGSCG